MFSFAKMDDRFELMRRMGDTVGAPLDLAVAEGRLTGSGVRAAAYRCAMCRHGEDCAYWLEDHAEGAAHPPAYCRNRALMEGLKARA